MCLYIPSGRKILVDQRKDGETSTHEDGTSHKLAYKILMLLLVIMTEKDDKPIPATYLLVNKIKIYILCKNLVPNAQTTHSVPF
jgi:hypothetical protein